eukprot:UN08571
MVTEFLPFLSTFLMINIVTGSNNWICNGAAWTTQSGQWLYNNGSLNDGGIVLVEEIQGAV